MRRYLQIMGLVVVGLFAAPLAGSNAFSQEAEPADTPTEEASAEETPAEETPPEETPPEETPPEPKKPDLLELPRGAIVRVGGASPEGKYDGIYRVIFTPDGKTLITRSLIGQAINVWDAATGELKRNIKGHELGITTLALSDDGNFLITAADDREDEVRVWDVRTGDLIRAVPGGGKLAQVLPDHTTLVVVGDEKITNYDLATGGPLGEFASVRIPLALSPDGKLLVSLKKLDDDKLVLVETTTGKETIELPGLTANPAAVRFSPDGTLVAVAGRREEQVKIWSIEQQKVVMTLTGHDGFIQDVAFTADGRFAVTGSWDRSAGIFEMTSGELIAGMEGHREKVVSVGFSPDGKLLATGASGREDASALVWRVRDVIAPSSSDPEKIDEAALETAWTQLADTSPKAAFGACGVLLTSPERGLAFVRGKIEKELKPAEADFIEKLIKDLDSGEFGVREKATEELIRLRASADTFLRKALEGDPSPEMKFRIGQILAAKTPDSKLTPEEWNRLRRLVYALELMGGADQPTAKGSREFLTLLSTGHADVKVMREAVDALKRLPPM